MIGFLIGFLAVGALGAAFILFAPKGWRTVLVNAVQQGAIFGVATAAQVFDQLGGFHWSTILDQKAAAGAALAVLVTNTVLRAITDSPIFKRVTGRE